MKAKERFIVAREAQGFPNWELLALGIRWKPRSWTPASDWAPIRLVTVSFWPCLLHVMLEVRTKARGYQLYFLICMVFLLEGCQILSLQTVVKCLVGAGN